MDSRASPISRISACDGSKRARQTVSSPTNKDASTPSISMLDVFLGHREEEGMSVADGPQTHLPVTIVALCHHRTARRSRTRAPTVVVSHQKGSVERRRRRLSPQKSAATSVWGLLSPLDVCDPCWDGAEWRLGYGLELRGRLLTLCRPSPAAKSPSRARGHASGLSVASTRLGRRDDAKGCGSAGALPAHPARPRTCTLPFGSVSPKKTEPFDRIMLHKVLEFSATCIAASFVTGAGSIPRRGHAPQPRSPPSPRRLLPPTAASARRRAISTVSSAHPPPNERRATRCTTRCTGSCSASSSRRSASTTDAVSGALQESIYAASMTPAKSCMPPQTGSSSSGRVILLAPAAQRRCEAVEPRLLSTRVQCRAKSFQFEPYSSRHVLCSPRVVPTHMRLRASLASAVEPQSHWSWTALSRSVTTLPRRALGIRPLRVLASTLSSQKRRASKRRWMLFLCDTGL
ncbi:hypothetical protein MKEN_00192100 [Mycena kentingensis (nom. inval.)]|nr:hypothetical protein MKEN_00192100 [Mycena kentingensis (nom. inval.)]